MSSSVITTNNKDYAVHDTRLTQVGNRISERLSNIDRKSLSKGSEIRITLSQIHGFFSTCEFFHVHVFKFIIEINY